MLIAAPGAVAQDATDVAAGAEAYQATCAACHGERVISAGVLPDLRKLRPEDREKFATVVNEGKAQMPAWGGVLSEEQIGQIWAYIRSRAAN
jgi:cytochrome c55X